MFDWLRFFDHHGIRYVRSGPNASQMQPAIKCPWCRDADPSEHMSISLRGAGWRCFRNPQAHVGRARHRLIQALLNCSVEEARRLAGEEASPTPDDEDILPALAKMLGEEDRLPAVSKTLNFPKEFKPLKIGAASAAPFWRYMYDRGYSDRDTALLVEHYKLHYATRGPYRYRLIIPVYDAEGALQTWTARSILPDAEVRYKTLSVNQPWNLPPSQTDRPFVTALNSPSNLLLGLPWLLRVPNPEVLVLCEGQFDAFRITAIGWENGVYGTCLFGLNVSEAQVALLDRLMQRFRKLVLLLDPDAQLVALRVRDNLTLTRGISSGRLPEGVEDPGALRYIEGRELIQSWL